MDEEVLDVPGRLRLIHTPGHTAGNAAISLDREVLIVGDALATINLVSGESGPRLLPRFVNEDHELALASLQKIEAVKARWVLSGHGSPWEGSPQQAVRMARHVAARIIEWPRFGGSLGLSSDSRRRWAFGRRPSWLGVLAIVLAGGCQGALLYGLLYYAACVVGLRDGRGATSRSSAF